MLKLRRLRCSFCGKDETEVSKLVAGARAFICDECAAAVNRIMSEPDDDPPREAQRSSGRNLLKSAGRFLRGGGARRVSSLDVAG